MEISVSTTDISVNIKITGSINDSHERQLKQEFDMVVARPGKEVILDLKFLPSITDTRISTLVILRRQLKKHNRELIIHGLHKNLVSAFASMSLDRLFTIKP